MRNYNLNNIRKGWKTTLLSFLLILASVASVLLDYANWTEVTPVILIGLGLLPLKQ